MHIFCLLAGYIYTVKCCFNFIIQLLYVNLDLHKFLNKSGFSLRTSIA